MIILKQFLILTGYAGQSRNVNFPNYGAFSTNESSRYTNGHTQAQLQSHPHYSDEVGPSNQITARANDSKYLGDGNVYQRQPVNSRIANNHGNDYEGISSQQALTRTLPPSLLPSTLNAELNSSSSQIWNADGSSYYSAGPSSSISKGHMREHSGMSNGNEVLMYENSGSRILPPSMMHVKSTAAMQFATSSDSVYRPVIGEERVSESDERLIYQAALEVCYSFNCN